MNAAAPAKESVLVIGAGIAGVAAAYSLRQQGFTVAICERGLGATDYMSGAFDLQPWNGPLTASNYQDSGLDDFCSALGLFAGFESPSSNATSRDGASDLSPGTGSMVVSSAGVVRPCTRAALGILDLRPHAGKSVAVFDSGRSDFPALAMVRALTESGWAQSSGTRFEVFDGRGAFTAQERCYPLAHFAHLLDEPQRRESFWQWLVANVGLGARESFRPSALLLGPWLGASLQRQELRVAGLSLGECLHLPETAMGTRWRVHRDRLLEHCGVRALSVHIESLAIDADTGKVVALPPHPAESLIYEGVVVACGGLLGGGTQFVATRRGENSAWLKRSVPSLEPDVGAGELAGWDPSTAPREWLHAAGSARSCSPRIQHASVESSLALSGPDTLGRAALRGLRAASRLAGIVDV